MCTQATSLHSAAAHGKLEDVKRLLTTDVKRVNSRDKRQVRYHLNAFYASC